MAYYQSNEPYKRVKEESSFNYGLGAFSAGTSLAASAAMDFKGESFMDWAEKRNREQGNTTGADSIRKTKENTFIRDKSNPNYNRFSNLKSGRGRALNYGASALSGAIGFLG